MMYLIYTYLTIFFYQLSTYIKFYYVDIIYGDKVIHFSVMRLWSNTLGQDTSGIGSYKLGNARLFYGLFLYLQILIFTTVKSTYL